MLATDQKGAIAESAIAHAAIRLGLGVFKPLTDGERYDLIFDLRPGLLRVQCKWAVRERDVVMVRCYSSRRTGEGSSAGLTSAVKSMRLLPTVWTSIAAISCQASS